MNYDSDVYQTGYAEYFAKWQFDDARQTQKARKALAALSDYFGAERLKELALLDIGCSTGLMTKTYAPAFARTVGIDIDEPAIEYASAHFAHENLTFRVADAMEPGARAGSFDVVICAHIYEHVPNPFRMMKGIAHALKPGGICYFAAQNRLTPMEPHYLLPFLSFLPKPLANVYYRAAGKGERYYENLFTLGQLRRLVRGFEIIDYTTKIIADPVKFHAEEMLEPGSLKQRLSLNILARAYFLCPTYVWLLRKPLQQDTLASK